MKAAAVAATLRVTPAVGTAYNSRHSAEAMAVRCVEPAAPARPTADRPHRPRFSFVSYIIAFSAAVRRLSDNHGVRKRHKLRVGKP